MPTAMIKQQLLAAPAWTQLTVDTITEVLLVGPSVGYEVIIATMAPGPSDTGVPITSSDGTFRWSGFAASEAVFARPFGAGSSNQPTITGLSAAPVTP